MAGPLPRMHPCVHMSAAQHRTSRHAHIPAAAPLQVVTPLVEAMRWGQGAAALVLETLQRALASSNSQRDLLVGQALRAGLLQRLLGLLDWRNGAQLVQGEESSGSGGGRAGAQAACFMCGVNTCACGTH